MQSETDNNAMAWGLFFDRLVHALEGNPYSRQVITEMLRLTPGSAAPPSGDWQKYLNNEFAEAKARVLVEALAKRLFPNEAS